MRLLATIRRKWRCWHHQHDDGPYVLVDNPAWYDSEGQWHPPDPVMKCRYCGETWNPAFPVSNGKIAS